MLSKNSYRSFDECPEYKAEQFFFRLPFFIPKILECLFHGYAQLLPELSRVKAKESPVERMDHARVIWHTQMSLEIVSVAARS